jgi:hypothetical protein
MKYFVVLIAFVFGFGRVQAQDTIYRVNGKLIPAQVVEVSSSQVKYKNPNGSLGPLFVLNKSEVRKIVYANGSEEILNNTYRGSDYAKVWNDEIRDEDPFKTKFNRRMIQLNVPDYFAGSLTFSYEYFTKSGDYSMRVPVSIGLNSVGLNRYAVLESQYGRQGYYRENKKFSTGFDINYFPNGQGKVRYFIGPSVEFGWFDYHDFGNVGNYPYTLVDKKMSANFQSLLLQNGFLFQPTANFNFSLLIGMGYTRTRYMHDDVLNTYPDDIYVENFHDFAFRAGMNVGYRF